MHGVERYCDEKRTDGSSLYLDLCRLSCLNKRLRIQQLPHILVNIGIQSWKMISSTKQILYWNYQTIDLYIDISWCFKVNCTYIEYDEG